MKGVFVAQFITIFRTVSLPFHGLCRPSPSAVTISQLQSLMVLESRLFTEAVTPAFLTSRVPDA